MHRKGKRLEHGDQLIFHHALRCYCQKCGRIINWDNSDTYRITAECCKTRYTLHPRTVVVEVEEQKLDPFIPRMKGSQYADPEFKLEDHMEGEEQEIAGVESGALSDEQKSLRIGGSSDAPVIFTDPRAKRPETTKSYEHLLKNKPKLKYTAPVPEKKKRKRQEKPEPIRKPAPTVNTAVSNLRRMNRPKQDAVRPAAMDGPVTSIPHPEPEQQEPDKPVTEPEETGIQFPVVSNEPSDLPVGKDRITRRDMQEVERLRELKQKQQEEAEELERITYSSWDAIDPKVIVSEPTVHVIPAEKMPFIMPKGRPEPPRTLVPKSEPEPAKKKKKTRKKRKVSKKRKTKKKRRSKKKKTTKKKTRSRKKRSTKKTSGTPSKKKPRRKTKKKASRKPKPGNKIDLGEEDIRPESE